MKLDRQEQPNRKRPIEHSEKDPNKGPESPARRSFLAKGLALTISGVAGTLIPRFIDQKDVPRRKEDLPPYPKELIQSFFKNRIEPVLTQLNNKQHPITEINSHFSAIGEMILQRYGKSTKVEYALRYAKEGAKAMASPHVDKDNQPFIYIFTPSHVDLYEKAKREKVQDINSLFANTLTITVIHEMEHLALGHETPPARSREEFLKKELEAWEHTCEHVIDHFIKRGLPISESDRIYYDAWNAWRNSGKSMISQERQRWLDFMKNTHADAWKDYPATQKLKQ